MTLWKTIACLVVASSASEQRKPRYYWAAWKSGIYSVDAESGTDIKKESNGLSTRCRSMKLHEGQCSIYVTQEERRAIAKIGLDGTIHAGTYHETDIFEQAKLVLDKVDNFLYYIGEPEKIFRIPLSNPRGIPTWNHSAVEEMVTKSGYGGAGVYQGFAADTISDPPVFYFYSSRAGCIFRQEWGDENSAECFYDTLRKSPYYGNPEHIVVDPVGRNLYFSLKGKLWRKSLDEYGSAQTILDKSGDCPNFVEQGLGAFAFDDSFTEVYWHSGRGQCSPEIHKATFDPTAQQFIEKWKVSPTTGGEIYDGFVLNDATIQHCFPTTTEMPPTTEATPQMAPTTMPAPLPVTPSPSRKCVNIPVATAREWDAQSCGGPEP